MTTVPLLTPLPVPTTDKPATMALTRRDLAVQLDLYRLRFAPKQAVHLLAASAMDAPPSAVTTAHFDRRLTAGLKAGLWFALKPGTTYLKGAQWRYFTVESGKARMVADCRVDALKMDATQWKDVLDAAEPWRVQVTDILASQGVPYDDIRSTLERTTDTALRWMAGRASHLAHYALAASFLSQLWYGLRSAGVTIDAYFPDKAADLSFESGKHTVTIAPDFVFLTGTNAVILEAETGTAGRAKVADKIARYLKLQEIHGPKGIGEKLGVPVTSARVVFFCATASHERLVQDEIAKAGCSRMFLTANLQDWHLGDEPRCDKWSKDDWRENRVTADGRRLYQRLADRAFEPLFSLVTANGVERVVLFAR